MNRIILILLLGAVSFLYAEQPNDCDVLAADPYAKPLPLGIKGIKLDDIESEKAIKVCTKAVVSFPNESRYAYQLGRAFYAKKDYRNALKAYTFSAEEGNKAAQYSLGRMYRYGTFVKYNQSKAFEWIEKAAKQDHTAAQYDLGLWYGDGYAPVNKDCNESIKWFTRSAKARNRNSQESLGIRYSTGECVKVDDKEAFKWFLKSAKNGSTYSKAKVAEMYASGRFIKRDDFKALQWYKSAVKDNSTYFKYQSQIAYLYSRGSDCDSYDRMAKRCKEGEYYGLRKDYTEAFKWQKKAALQGYNIAQESISDMYYNGNGVKKNYILAYAWLNLAKSNEGTRDWQMERYAKKFEKLEAKMTRQQIAIAQEYDPIKANKEKLNSHTKKVPSGIYTGTGFFINPTTIVTNHHVVKKCKSIDIIRGDYKTSAKLSMADSRNDLAVLKTIEKNDNFLHFRAGKGIRIGEEIIVLGYPFGKLLGTGVKLTTGNISALTGLVDDVTSIQITAPVQPGNSGGPLLDNSGNLVGIVVARLEKDLSGNIAQNVNIAIKSNILKMLLSTNGIDYSMSVLKDKKEVVDIADDTKKSVVQVVCYK